MGSISKQQYLAGIQNGLAKKLDEHQAALPAGFQKERYVLNCMTLISDMLLDDKKAAALSKINPATIPLCFMKGAVLGLDFFNGECYAIPYGSEMKFQTDYKGEIKLNKKYSKSPIRDIYAKVVREGDEFYEEINGGDQNIYFRPVPFSDRELVGAFAVVKYKDGSLQYETMSRTEIEKIRNSFSKAANSKAWKETPGEMYKKTVLRRLVKFIDLDFDNVDQIKAYEDGGDAEFDKDAMSAIESGRIVNVFEKPKEAPELPKKEKTAAPPKQERKPEPEPISDAPEPMPAEADFQQFEADFDQSMMEELPFK